MKVYIGPYPDQMLGDEEVEVKVRIHDYDLWNLDWTLAQIILPALKKMKKKKNGHPIMLLEDIPESFDVSQSDLGLLYSGRETDEISKKFADAWEWALDEMIWSFQRVVEDKTYNEEKDERMKKGLALFGKYYLALWD